MATRTKIAWTDMTWNPVRGCSMVSAGCQQCYAMQLAHRFSGAGQPYEGLTRLTEHGPVWTGKVRLVPEALDEPLRWRKPCRVFVNSMSDLFHEDVPDEFIAAVFGVMAASMQHSFQILTKRPMRMCAWFQWLNQMGGLGPHIRAMRPDGDRTLPDFFSPVMRTQIVNNQVHRTSDDPWMRVFNAGACIGAGPLPNVWLGVSVEDQATADERIPLLRQTPAAVRFLSVEPLLERIELREGWRYGGCRSCGYSGYLPSEMEGETQCACCVEHLRDGSFAKIDWVIIGGESGPGARPTALENIRAVVDQCRAAGVPCFVKQEGSFPVMRENEWRSRQPTVLLDAARSRRERTPDGYVALLANGKGGGLEHLAEKYRIREFPPR